jgi:hypothetical protein
VRPRDPKAVLMEWVDDQVQLDTRTKYILDKFARFADQEMRAGRWSPIWRADQLLRADGAVRAAPLEADGLIRRTGEMHTLNEGSRFPRKVPIFQIAPGVEGIDPLAASGAKLHPSRTLGCKASRLGCNSVAPRNELIGTDTPSDEGDARARATGVRTAGGGLSEARAGLHQPGPGAGRVLAAAGRRDRRRGADPRGRVLRQRPGGQATDQALDHWLADGKYRGWWPDAQLALGAATPAASAAIAEVAPHAAPEADQAIWRGVAERMAAALNEGEYGSYIRPLTLCVGGPEPGRWRRCTWWR